MDTPFGDSPQDLNGLTVVDGEGHKVGSVQRVYKDDVSGAPEWVTVRTGLFGTKETFVPLADAHREDDKLRVPYSKDRIKDAPRVDAESHLDAAEEKDLYRYYGRGRPASGTESASGKESGTGTAGDGPRHAAGTGESAPMAGAGAGMGAGGMAMSSRGREGADTGMDSKESEQNTRAMGGTGAMSESKQGMDSKEGMDTGRSAAGESGKGGMADREMTLSEERFDVSTEEYESGRARLSKHVVTEEVTRSVPVSHEEVHLTREQLTDEDRRAESGRTSPRIEDGQVEITLHEERPVVRKESVPVERIRLETERVTEQQEVSTEIRKEEAEFDDGQADRTDGTKGAAGKGRGTGTKGATPKEAGTKGTDPAGSDTKGTGREGPGEFR